MRSAPLALVMSLLLATTVCSAAARPGRARLGGFFDPLDSALDFWSPFSRAINKQWSTGLRPTQGSTPEITETETAYYITLDTAGFTKEELDIHVVGHEISIEGNHKCDKPGLCIARHFAKRYTIFGDINLDGISSRRTSDGVLQLAVPKIGRRSIRVSVADEPEQPASNPELAAAAGVGGVGGDTGAGPVSRGTAPDQKMEEVTVEIVN